MESTASHPFSQPESPGRKTILFDRCHREKDGDVQCVFICQRKGGKYYAMDIPVDREKPSLGLDMLRRHSGGWWKRYSLYSVVAVREINIRLMEAEKPERPQNRFQACILDIDYTSIISNVNKGIERTVEHADEATWDHCGVDVNGKIHENKDHCDNMQWNGVDGVHCSVEKRLDLERQRSHYQWLRAMIEYYWQNGIDARGLDFMENVGFVHSYKNLQYDTYRDTDSPYDSPLGGFLLIEGWHVRYLLTSIGLSLSGSVCIIAVVAAATREIETSLAAGSYVCAFAVGLVAIFTFLSAVL